MDNNFIEIYENALDDDFCDSIVREFEYLHRNNWTHKGISGVIEDNNDRRKDSWDLDFTRYINFMMNDTNSSISFQDGNLSYNDFTKKISDKVLYYLTKYEKKYDSLAVFLNLNSIDLWPYGELEKKRDESLTGTFFQMDGNLLSKKYEKNKQGYHIWHADIDNYSESKVKRSHVVMFYLNDVEEGGETEFYHQGVKIKPKKGTCVIFPTFYTHLHRGNIPLSNDKYILNTWIKPYSRMDN